MALHLPAFASRESGRSWILSLDVGLPKFGCRARGILVLTFNTSLQVHLHGEQVGGGL